MAKASKERCKRSPAQSRRIINSVVEFRRDLAIEFRESESGPPIAEETDRSSYRGNISFARTSG